MKLNVKKIKGYNCPSKYLLLINGEPTVFANSRGRISLLIQYLEGYNVEEQINDKAVLKVLKSYRNEGLDGSYNM